MTIEELINEWKTDSRVDIKKLHEESLNIPVLHEKYLTVYLKERLKFFKLKEDRKLLEKNLFEYYNGDMNNKEASDILNKEPCLKIYKSKELIDKAVNADKLMIDINIKINVFEEKLKYLEEILKAIKDRNFQIKNTIDFIRFKEGG